MSLCFKLQVCAWFVLITLSLFAIQVCCLIPIIYWVCAQLFIYANPNTLVVFSHAYWTKQLKNLLSMSSVCLFAQSLSSFINYHNPYELLCSVIYLHRVWALIWSAIAFRNKIVLLIIIVLKQYQLLPNFYFFFFALKY